MPTFTSKEELQRTNQTYDCYIDEWQFFIRSYYGGKMYKDGNYLMQHPFESEKNYTRRKAISYYYNFCRPIIDIFVSQIYRKKIERDFGSLKDDQLFQSFLKDADLEGKSFEQYMKETNRLASTYGRVSVIVDKASTDDELTKAHEIDKEIRPYLTTVTPENLLDWKWKRLSNGRKVLDWIKIGEDRDKGGVFQRFRVWTREDWQVWVLNEVEGEVTPILHDSGEHPVGEVPIVNVFNQKTELDLVGLSDIDDIADVNKNIYYLCSDAKEIIENTAFPMLAKAMGKEGQEGTVDSVGPKNIEEFDPDAPNGKPFWLEAPHSSLSEIREWINQDVREIHRIAKMGGIQVTENATQPKSGVALEIESQQQQSVLSEKADNMEEAETNILRIWAKWQEGEFDGSIDYPDDFSIRDVQRDIDNAIKAKSLNITSTTYNKSIDKKTARQLLPKADEDTLIEIDKEIEAGAISIVGTPLSERLADGNTADGRAEQTEGT